MAKFRWGRAECADLAAPPTARALLDIAIAARPDQADLRLKSADWLLDRYDFEGAAQDYEAALALDPSLPGARQRLARCLDALGRHENILEILAVIPRPEHYRALALIGLAREVEAEREWRALLAMEPHHRPACRHLNKILRKSGRIGEIVELCESLHALGVRHSQLLYAWGTALALSGHEAEARAILLDRERVAELALPVPRGFSDIASFNAALAEELLGNPNRLSNFPEQEEANRGSSRVHALFAGRRPELIRGLIDSLQRVIEAHAPRRYSGFDPWADARPGRAHLKAWGLIQRGDDYEEWHSHPGGWMSGVYYIQVPEGVTAEGAGPGCIEFGPPTALSRERPGYVPVWRHAPREGMLLLAPSHYAHRTIPTGADRHRISFAFDVVVDG